MLGRRISDPHGVEGPPAAADGLGLLDVETELTGAKVLRRITGRLTQSGAAFDAYEMHVGRTTGAGLERPFATFDEGGADGAVSADGRVAGVYLHGLFNATPARATLLAQLGATSSGADHAAAVDAALDEIAQVLSHALDIDALAAIAGLRPAGA
jgi:adenosylcobyric acid synthase